MKQSQVTSSVLGVVGVLTLAGCWPLIPGSPAQTPSTSPGKAGLFLEYNDTYDQQGDNDGGAKIPTDIPIVWQGTRVLAVEEQAGPGDTFTVNDPWHGVATDPWYKTTIVPNLDPGNWNLAVTVNGMPMSCGAPIALSSSVQNQVTFQVDKVSGQFTGCTHT